MELKEEKIGLIGGGRGGINYTPAQRELAEKYRANKKICRKWSKPFPRTKTKSRCRKIWI